MTNKHTHESGVITWTEGDTAVMVCPECGTESDWPWGDDDDRCQCYGGCGRWFDLDEAV